MNTVSALITFDATAKTAILNTDFDLGPDAGPSSTRTPPDSHSLDGTSFERFCGVQRREEGRHVTLLSWVEVRYNSVLQAFQPSCIGT